MKILISASPFTTPTNNHKFAASTACIFNVAHFGNYPLTSVYHFSTFFEKSCIFDAVPNIFTSSVSMDHPVLPFPAPCCCPSAGADTVPFAPPISFPPTIVLCSMNFSPISALCMSYNVAPDMGAFPSAGNFVACSISLLAAPPWNHQCAWGQRRRIFVSPSVTSPDRAPRWLLVIPCRIPLYFFLLALVRRPFCMPG